jgi:hypothetical protein
MPTQSRFITTYTDTTRRMNIPLLLKRYYHIIEQDETLNELFDEQPMTVFKKTTNIDDIINKKQAYLKRHSLHSSS